MLLLPTMVIRLALRQNSRFISSSCPQRGPPPKSRTFSSGPDRSGSETVDQASIRPDPLSPKLPPHRFGLIDSATMTPLARPDATQQIAPISLPCLPRESVSRHRTPQYGTSQVAFQTTYLFSKLLHPYVIIETKIPVFTFRGCPRKSSS